MGIGRFRSAGLVSAAIVLALIAACQTPPPRELPPVHGHGPPTTYVVVLRSFHDRDAHAIIQVMAERFPGYESHNLVSKTDGARNYRYRTTAKAFKLEEWLFVLLGDMGFDTEREIAIHVQGVRLSVERLPPPPSAPQPDQPDSGKPEPEKPEPAEDDDSEPPPRSDAWVPITGDRFK